MKPESVEALRLIEHFAALCATAGISEENKNIANDYIHSLLSLIKEDVTNMSLTSKGVLL